MLEKPSVMASNKEFLQKKRVSEDQSGVSNWRELV